MKRIIDHKTYNTVTAQRIACGKYTYEKRCTDWFGRQDLYRTRGGAFFLVEMEWCNAEDKHTALEPISYDEAHKFVLGGRGVSEVDLFVNGIFPTIRAKESQEY
jgi:hypothetical protein